MISWICCRFFCLDLCLRILLIFVVVDIGVDDDEQDLDFVNKLDILQIKREKKKVKTKILYTRLYLSVIIKNQSKK